jgi:hypothetical protein
MRIIVPASETQLFRAWLKYYRPVLMRSLQPQAAGWEHSYLFVKRDGSAPRHEINNATSAVQRHYLGHAAAAHRFRAMQATDGQVAGISPQEHKAMCAGRQHSESAASRYYVKANRNR